MNRSNESQAEFVCLDGAIVPSAMAVLPVSDTGILQGIGLFETIAVVARTPLFFAEHIGRLRRSAHLLDLPPPCSWERLARCVRTLIRANEVCSGAVRVTITGGPRHAAGHAWRATRLLIALRPGNVLTAAAYAEGVELVWTPWSRSADNPLLRHKTTSNFENVFARAHAQTRGAFDAVFCDSRGRVLEGAVSNIFIVKRGRVVTPTTLLPILPGITRAVVLALCRRAGLAVRQEIIQSRAVDRADEIFATSAVVGVLPVSRFDGARVGTGRAGRVTKTLMAAYEDEVVKQARVFGPRRKWL